MAALPESPPMQVLDLRHLRADALDSLLAEEVEHWRRSLHWDFRASADLVRRFVGMRALSGVALHSGGRTVGYCYYVTEDRKGLIGDLYVCDEFRSAESEGMLLSAVLDVLLRPGFVRRVESQPMMMLEASARDLRGAAYLKTFERNFMRMDLAGVENLPEGAAFDQIELENWQLSWQEESAHVIADAYYSHVDSLINDQYRSVAGARHFLTNIVQYPGCGTFYAPASFVAWHRESRRVCGVCLSSMVAREVGHITQVCVSPAVKGTGVGYELMRTALQSFAAAGCREATLTVTASNAKAVELYERLGFRTMKRFHACVWEGF
ncbi:MAG: GNAT family N-acetyltransferase [Bryobacteraceae bacterium]|nr:GNAT family N-acetyltransferase [Bryobacteraceae bacterium]